MQPTPNKLDTLLIAQKSPRHLIAMTDQVEKRNRDLEEKLKQLTNGAGIGKRPSGSLYVDNTLFGDMCSDDESGEESVVSSQEEYDDDEYDDEEEDEEENDASIEIGEESSEERKKRKASTSLSTGRVEKCPRQSQYNTLEEVRRIQKKAELDLMRQEKLDEMKELDVLIRGNIRALADQRQLLSLAEIEIAKALNALESKEQGKPPLFAVDYEKENARLNEREKSLMALSQELASREKSLATQSEELQAKTNELMIREKSLATQSEAKTNELVMREKALEKSLADLLAREKRVEEQKTVVVPSRTTPTTNGGMVVKNDVALDAIMAEVIKNNTMQMSPQEFAPLLSEPVKNNLAFLSINPGIKACAQTVGTHEFLYIREASSERVLLKMAIAKQLLSPK